jgi:NAD(P)-dependent dehydrogenase (short-subunit alcohol dehydrogenase family)
VRTQTAQRSALVTGATSGIGDASARALLAAGFQVIGTYRNPADAEAIRSRGLIPVQLDLLDPASIELAAKEVLELDCCATGLDVLVNNAGIVRGGPVEFLDIASWREQFEANLFGQVLTTQAFLPAVREMSGRIIFIGSISGRISSPLLAPYSASKFAIEGLAEALRHELRPWGIRTIVVEPGAVATKIWPKGRALVEELKRDLPAEALARYAAAVADLERSIASQERASIPPERVGRIVVRAATVRRPRARYLVGVDAVLGGGVVARVMPDAARDVIVRKLMGV